jgi:hypothetical protein
MLYVIYTNKDKDFIKFKFSPRLKIKLHILSFGVQTLKQDCRVWKVIQLSFWSHLCLSPRAVVKFFFTGRSLQFPKITNKSLRNSLSLPPLALLCFSALRFAAVPRPRHLLLQVPTRLEFFRRQLCPYLHRLAWAGVRGHLSLFIFYLASSCHGRRYFLLPCLQPHPPGHPSLSPPWAAGERPRAAAGARAAAAQVQPACGG